MFYGFVITEAGNSLLASMVAGQTLTITKAVMGEGTADNAEAARKLTNLITPGPEATSTEPTVDGNNVNMIVEYRSDLNGGLQEGFWIGEFGIFGKVGNGAETMIGYGSLGDAKQYVSAYVAGAAPDVRRYPVSITVTTGIQVDVAYPAEAWMTAEDVAEYFNQTLKPDLEESLQDLIDDHNEDPDAHGGALEGKQDQIKAEGILKGTKTTTEEGDTYSVGAATPGTDYQAPTNALTAAAAMTTQDLIPFYDVATGQHKRTTLQALKEAIGVQSPAINVTTCAGASVTCSDGVTTLEGTGSTEFELPNVGNWTVTATLDGESVSEVVEVSGALLYEVDLMITSGIAVTAQPDKTTYFIGEEFDPEGMVVTATFADDTTADVTEDCTFSPETMAAGTQSVTITYVRAGVTKTTTVAVAVRTLDHIAVTTPPNKTAYKYGETFQPAGMVVTAYYTDETSRTVTGYTYSPHRRPGHGRHHDHRFLYGGEREQADHPGHHRGQGAGEYRDHHAPQQNRLFLRGNLQPGGHGGDGPLQRREQRGGDGVHLLPHRRPGHGQHHDHRFLCGGRRDQDGHPGHHRDRDLQHPEQQFLGYHQGRFGRRAGRQLLGRRRHQADHDQRKGGEYEHFQPGDQRVYYRVQPQRQPGGFQPDPLQDRQNRQYPGGPL